MTKTLVQAEAADKAPPAPDATQQPPLAEKQASPLRLGRAAQASEASPNAPPPARPEDAMNASASTGSAALRARTMRMMQRSIGNSRIERALNDRVSAADDKGGSTPAFAVSPPNSPEEKQAEAVANAVTTGKPVPPISPLSASAPQMPLSRKEQEEEKPMQAQRQGAGAVQTAPAAHAIAQKGAGSPVNPTLRGNLERRMGADLSGARVHSDAQANEAASALNARAFATGQDIFMARGESSNDPRLMAHELTHVVQQTGGASRAVQTAPAQSPKAEAKEAAPAPPKGQRARSKAPAEVAVAPGLMELKGKSEFNPGPEIDAFFDEHKKAKVNVQFGKFAQGQIEVKKDSRRKETDQYQVEPQALDLSHPIFARMGEVPAELKPSLIVGVRKGKLHGHVGLRGETKLSSKDFQNASEALGLAGISLDSLPDIVNEIQDGSLHLGIRDAGVTFGAAFSGKLTLVAVDEKITFQGSAQIAVKNLAKGQLELQRSEEGVITGKANVAVEPPTKSLSGSVDVAWDGAEITGVGKVGYQGEKLQGEVVLRLMEKEKAEALEKEKKAPEGEAPQEAKSGGGAAPAKRKAKKVQYAIFGEGDLTFTFNEWLNGTAHVIVTPSANVTVIGKITPQKEFTLFEQADYIKPLFKLEARASYGIPVVGNVFIFGNLGMDAFAKLGPGTFKDIVVEGTYSTDPKVRNDFRIQGTLNISAAAGLRLRAEVGAGLEILDHDLKAGAGINGIAGIRGYAEAKPIIGYREQGNEGEDKKGEFYIRGELEIAAQPFLGLSGDLFFEVDAPWWSPVDDDRWTWPLGGKEWPIGGTFGIGASVEYVFGSKQLPSVNFNAVNEFDSDKFVTALYEDKAKPKSGEAPDKKGDWKEKNQAAAEPPAITAGKGDAKPGAKAPEPPPAKSKAPSGKKIAKPAEPNAKTAEGKSVKELQDEASKKGKKPEGKEVAKGATKEGKGEKEKGKIPLEGKDAEQKWQRGATVVQQALAYAEKTGIDQKELNQILKSIKKQKQFGFTELYAEDGGAEWLVLGSMSPAKKITSVKKKPGLLPGEGNVGTYGQLVKEGKPGDDITPHHMPADRFMAKYDIPRNQGISMNMEQPQKGGRHRRTRTYGTGPNLDADPRKELEDDIKDVRKIYSDDGLGSAIEPSLKNVRELNHAMYYFIFEKGKKSNDSK